MDEASRPFLDVVAYSEQLQRLRGVYVEPVMTEDTERLPIPAGLHHLRRCAEHINQARIERTKPTL